MKNVIMSYNMPDMDGISCMYAYSELLNKQNIETTYLIAGEPKKEVKIVCDLFNIQLKGIENINKEDKIILVDTNNTKELKRNINADNIVEIIDHHKVADETSKMKNVKLQIEEVGAAATLVAERFKESNYKISENAAILLYYGIISNTVNLNSNITTNRDKEMVKWLKSITNRISEKKIKEIFEKKSEITENLREEMEVEFKDDFLTISWSMGQLEIANVDEFLVKNERDIIEILEKVSKEKEVEYISVNCLDILNGYAVIIALNRKTEDLISEILNIKFENKKAKINKFVTRKEIVKKVRQKYGKQ